MTGSVTGVPATPTWWRPALLGIVGIAVAARIAFALLLAPDLPPPGDAGVYRAVAHNLASGDGFTHPAPGGGPEEPSAEHPPLFPVVLAGLERLGMGSVRAQGVALAVVSGVGVAIVALVGRRVAGPVAGLVAAGIAALHPMWLQSAGLVLSESLHLVLVPLVLLAALDLRARRTWTAALWLGLAVGAAALNRSEALGLVVVVAAPAVLAGAWRRADSWRQLGLVCVAAAVVLAPWLLRNRAELDAWVLSTNSGKTLFGSTCDDTFSGSSLGGFSYDCQFGLAEFLIDAGPHEGTTWGSKAFDDEFAGAARRYLDDHRGEVPKVVAARVLRMWGLAFEADQRRFDVEEGRHAGLQHAGQWLHLAVLAAALVGSVRLLRDRARRGELAVLLGPLVLVTATCLLIYGGSRMRTGAEPSLAVLASVAAVSIVGRVPPRR